MYLSVCLHLYIHAAMQTYGHINKCTSMDFYIYLHTAIHKVTCMHTHRHTRTYVCIHARRHMCIPTDITMQKRDCIHTCIYTQIQTQKHMCIHACIKTLRNAYINMYMKSRDIQPFHDNKSMTTKGLLLFVSMLFKALSSL